MSMSFEINYLANDKMPENIHATRIIMKFEIKENIIIPGTKVIDISIIIVFLA